MPLAVRAEQMLHSTNMIDAIASNLLICLVGGVIFGLHRLLFGRRRKEGRQAARQEPRLFRDELTVIEWTEDRRR